MSNSFTINTYSPKDVILSIGGYQLTGWQSINITRSKKAFQVIEGIRGKNTFVPNKSTAATITVSLLQSSASNEVMSWVLDSDISEGTGRLALTLKDKSGTSVFSSVEGRILGYPTVSFTGQFEYRNWEIYCCTTTTYTVGGNNRPETSLFDSALNAATDFVNSL
jgi:hypothetical protein